MLLGVCLDYTVVMEENGLALKGCELKEAEVRVYRISNRLSNRFGKIKQMWQKGDLWTKVKDIHEVTEILFRLFSACQKLCVAGGKEVSPNYSLITFLCWVPSNHSIYLSIYHLASWLAIFSFAESPTRIQAFCLVHGCIIMPSSRLATEKSFRVLKHFFKWTGSYFLCNNKT